MASAQQCALFEPLPPWDEAHWACPLTPLSAEARELQEQLQLLTAEWGGHVLVLLVILVALTWVNRLLGQLQARAEEASRAPEPQPAVVRVAPSPEPAAVPIDAQSQLQPQAVAQLQTQPVQETQQAGAHPVKATQGAKDVAARALSDGGIQDVQSPKDNSRAASGASSASGSGSAPPTHQPALGHNALPIPVPPPLPPHADVHPEHADRAQDGAQGGGQGQQGDEEGGVPDRRLYHAHHPRYNPHPDAARIEAALAAAAAHVPMGPPAEGSQGGVAGSMGGTDGGPYVRYDLTMSHHEDRVVSMGGGILEIDTTETVSATVSYGPAMQPAADAAAAGSQPPVVAAAGWADAATAVPTPAQAVTAPTSAAAAAAGHAASPPVPPAAAQAVSTNTPPTTHMPPQAAATPAPASRPGSSTHTPAGSHSPVMRSPNSAPGSSSTHMMPEELWLAIRLNPPLPPPGMRSQGGSAMRNSPGSTPGSRPATCPVGPGWYGPAPLFRPGSAPHRMLSGTGTPQSSVRSTGGGSGSVGTMSRIGCMAVGGVASVGAKGVQSSPQLQLHQPQLPGSPADSPLQPQRLQLGSPPQSPIRMQPLLPESPAVAQRGLQSPPAQQQQAAPASPVHSTPALPGSPVQQPLLPQPAVPPAAATVPAGVASPQRPMQGSPMGSVQQQAQSLPMQRSPAAAPAHQLQPQPQLQPALPAQGQQEDAPPYTPPPPQRPSATHVLPHAADMRAIVTTPASAPACGFGTHFDAVQTPMFGSAFGSGSPPKVQFDSRGQPLPQIILQTTSRRSTGSNGGASAGASAQQASPQGTPCKLVFDSNGVARNNNRKLVLGPQSSGEGTAAAAAAAAAALPVPTLISRREAHAGRAVPMVQIPGANATVAAAAAQLAESAGSPHRAGSSGSRAASSNGSVTLYPLGQGDSSEDTPDTPKIANSTPLTTPRGGGTWEEVMCVSPPAEPAPPPPPPPLVVSPRPLTPPPAVTPEVIKDWAKQCVENHIALNAIRTPRLDRSARSTPTSSPPQAADNPTHPHTTGATTTRTVPLLSLGAVSPAKAAGISPRLSASEILAGVAAAAASKATGVAAVPLGHGADARAVVNPRPAASSAGLAVAGLAVAAAGSATCTVASTPRAALSPVTNFPGAVPAASYTAASTPQPAAALPALALPTSHSTGAAAAPMYAAASTPRPTPASVPAPPNPSTQAAGAAAASPAPYIPSPPVAGASAAAAAAGASTAAASTPRPAAASAAASPDPSQFAAITNHPHVTTRGAPMSPMPAFGNLGANTTGPPIMTPLPASPAQQRTPRGRQPTGARYVDVFAQTCPQSPHRADLAAQPAAAQRPLLPQPPAAQPGVTLMMPGMNAPGSASGFPN